MIRWGISIPIMLLFGLLTSILAPILPAFREERLGLSGNGCCTAVEPRLPKWLSWFDTTDNSLWGDGGWKTEHCPDYKSYFGMVRWLWRNGGHNFNYQVLGCEAKPMPEKKEGVYYWKRDDGYWLYRRFFPLFFGYKFEVFLGWNLYGVVHNRCKIVCQFRIKKNG